jgi:hypothetical protein
MRLLKTLGTYVVLLAFVFSGVTSAFADSAGGSTNFSVSPVSAPAPGFATYTGMLLSGGTMVGDGGSQWGTPPIGMNVLGVNANVLALPSLSAGSNAIGSITNSSFGINGTLPAFTSPPTVNVGTFPALSAGSNTIGAVTEASGPWTFNLTQQAGAALSVPTAWGIAPAGGALVPNVNANIVAGTVSASFSGYSPVVYGAQVTVNNTSQRQAVSGSTVVLYNIGTNNAFTTIGNSSVTASTNMDVLYPNCWITYAVGANTDVALITASSTTTVNVSNGAGLPGGGCSATLTGASTVTANQGTATGGTAWPVSLAALPALAAGTNAIGSITNTGFNVTGTLPAFAATPTVNLGAIAGTATATNQEVTAAGTSAASAQGVQGVTGGVPFPTTAGPNTVTTGSISAIDSVTVCSATPPPIQTQCTGTPATGSSANVTAGNAGELYITASTAGGVLSAIQLSTEVSNDNITWYGRGLFLDSNAAPIWKNGISNGIFSGVAIGGVPYFRIRATTFTVSSGAPVVTITITQSQATPFVYVGNLPTGSNGTASVAAVSIQGNGPTALPVGTNLQQMAAVTLAAPTAWGTAPAGGSIVQDMNVNCIVGCAGNSSVGLVATTAPGSATYNGMLISGGNMVGASGSAWGSAPTGLNVLGVNADVLSLPALAAGTNAIGSITNTSFGISGALPALSAGSNAIGSITNTGFGITGTLPAFAATPTFNLGTIGGAATAANQEVTIAGTTATSAQAVQGATNGVPVTTADSGTKTTASPALGAGGAGLTGWDSQLDADIQAGFDTGTQSSKVSTVSPYPLGAVPITASATGTTAATTATLTNVTGHTTYICGYSVRANATAATTVLNTVTGVITATLSSELWVAPNASGIGVDEQIFMPCIPASAISTSIAVVSGAPGTGGLVSVKAWGFSL